MHHRSTGTAQRAFIVTIPVLLGYTAIGIAFGLLAVRFGFPWWVVVIMSALMYAGAGQYIGIELLATGAGIPEMALVTLLVNARHMVYGLSLQTKFTGTGAVKPYLIFALTDETYALLTTVTPPEGHDRSRFFFLIALLNQSYWVLAGIAGFFIGKLIPFNTEGLDFALTALFLVLLIEQIRSCRRWAPFIIAFVCSIAAVLIFGAGNMLIVSIVLSIIVLIMIRGIVGYDCNR